MKEKSGRPSRWWYAMPLSVMLLGLLLAVGLVAATDVALYPSMIADAYRGEQFRLPVPGSQDVKLLRTGAYGIYYEYSLASSIQPSDGQLAPPIDCTLTAESAGTVIHAVPDYVPTNRYWSRQEGGLGVLIMSITVEESDTYEFACHYQDDRTEPEIVVALGPNYFWQFLRVTARIGLPVLGAIAVLGGSLVMATVITAVVMLMRRQTKN